MQLKIPFNILLKMHLLVIQYWTVLRGFLELSCKSNSTESTYRQLKKAQNSLITWKKKSILFWWEMSFEGFPHDWH